MIQYLVGEFSEDQATLGSGNGRWRFPGTAGPIVNGNEDIHGMSLQNGLAALGKEDWDLAASWGRPQRLVFRREATAISANDSASASDEGTVER